MSGVHRFLTVSRRDKKDKHSGSHDKKVYIPNISTPHQRPCVRTGDTAARSRYLLLHIHNPRMDARTVLAWTAVAHRSH